MTLTMAMNDNPVRTRTSKRTSTRRSSHRPPQPSQPSQQQQQQEQQQQQQQQQQLLNFNSTRTAWILSFLLFLTLLTQVFLIAYHDDFVLQLNTLEGELLEDAQSLNSIATDAVNAVYEGITTTTTDDDGGSVVYYSSNTVIKASSDHHNHHHHYNNSMPFKRTTTKYANYSMEPEDILKRARVDYTAGFIPSLSVRESRIDKKNNNAARREASLPSLEEIQSMYGNKSYIQGLERCQEYRDKVPPEHRLMGPAGIFNSATNLLNMLLKLNCVNTARRGSKKYRRTNTGMMLQAPWGKHNPVAWRGHHEAAVGGKGIRQADFLPIVMIKDPITWMASMCRHSYEARWRHFNGHCPNLVPNKVDKGPRGRLPITQKSMTVKVKFATQHIGNEPMPDQKNRTFVEYSSLVDLWNVWYGDWYDVVEFPRLMVRFEDLMFHAEDTVTQVCECGGGTMRSWFRYVEDSAKGQYGPHAGSAGFLASLVTYGNSTLRMKGILTDEKDAEYARQHLDKDLMDIFGYAPI